MNNEIINEREEHIRIILDGKKSIQYETLQSFVESTGKLIKRTSKLVAGEGGKTELIVSNIEQGSIIFDFVTKLVMRDTILESVNSVFSVLKDVIALKTHLGDGKNVSVRYEGNNADYTNELGELLTVTRVASDMYSQNQSVDNELTEVFSKVSKDDTRDQMRIISQDVNTIDVQEIVLSKQEIANAAISVDVKNISGNIEEKIIENATVKVEKLDFSGDTKWSILIGEKKESVSILDFKFIEDVKDSKFVFNSNTVLIVDYKIEYYAENSKKSNKKSKFSILKVHEVINYPDDQIEMEL